MKTRTLTLLGIASSALLLAKPLFAQNTAVTAPVGYRTETILPGVFNLLSSNLNNAVSAAGDIESALPNQLFDDDVDFTALLTSGTNYTVKITGGSGEGYNTEVSTWDTTSLTTVDDLSGVVAAGDSYEVRATQTISDLFGAGNEAGLTTGDQNTADVVWIPGAGGFTQMFYDTAWRKVGALSFLEFPDEPVYFTDGIFVQSRAASSLDVVFTGHVLTKPTVTGVEGGGTFNYLSRVLPVDVKLGESGLGAGLTQGDQNTGDVVWVPDGTPGGYTQYYYNGAWRKVGALTFLEFPDDTLTSGFIVQRRGSAGNLTLDIPAGLDLDGNGGG